MLYRITYKPIAKAHIADLSAEERRLLRDAIPVQLTYQPDQVTTNRKRLEPNPVAGWALRVRHLRLYFDVEPDQHVVTVNAVGIKVRERVFIGGRDFTAILQGKEPMP